MGKQGGRSKYGGDGGPSERLLHPATHIASAPDRLGDLNEADVWSVGDGDSSSHRAARRWPAGGLSLAFDAQLHHHQHQQHHHHHNHHVLAGSAPVSVPEWPTTAAATTAASSGTGSSWDDESSAEEWVAPHEYLQRRRGAASVLVGAGRTLKGRDMSRVRDAVWSNTGFFG